MANTTIDQLPSLASTSISDRTKVHILVDDTQSTATTKQLLLSELDNLWATDARQTIIYSPSHGLTSGAASQPIGWKADNKPYVHTDTASTELPVALFVSSYDTNHIICVPVGGLVEVPNTIIPAGMPVNGGDTNSRSLYWDASAGAYVHAAPSDSLLQVQLLYWIGLKEGDSSTSVFMVLPWVQNAVPSTKLVTYSQTAVPTTGADPGMYSVQTGTNAGLYFWTGSEAVLLTAYSEDGDWPV